MVSVIIINYNTFRLTVNCIASIIKHTKEVEYEIILVDNHSKECDPDLFKQEFPDITLIKSSVNAGFSKGNNIGIEASKGDHVLLLNSDTELTNDAISIAIKKLQQNPDVGVISGKLIYPDGKPQAVAGRFPSLRAELFELFRIGHIYPASKLSSIYHSDQWDYNVSTETDWVWGAFFMLSKAVIKQFPNGRLHEDYFMYYEDVLWCYYIKHKLGYKILYMSEPVIIHYLSASSNEKDEYLKYKNKILPNQVMFLKKYKSAAYARAYYLLKALHQITLRKKKNLRESIFYFRLAIANIFN